MASGTNTRRGSGLPRHDTRILSLPFPVVLSLALTAFAAVGLATASVFRHDHFGSNAYDLGVYDQTIWGYSHFEMIRNTVTLSPNLLGDHFEPVLMAFGPLFWIWDDVRMLLLAQAALIATASLPIFFWAREELGTLPAVLFQSAYLIFWGVIGGDLYDFHEVAVAAPVVSLAIYAALTRRNALLWVAAGIAFLTKEDLALTIAALGIYIGVAQRRWRLGSALVAVALPWFVIVLKTIIPSISGRSYSHWTYTALGSGPGAAAKNLVEHPVHAVKLFVSPHAKARGLFDLFAPWLALPLVSPLVIVMIPSLAERFFSARPELWSQGFHYSVVIAPILAFAAIDSTARVRRILGGRGIRRDRLIPIGVGAAVLLAGAYFTLGRLRPLDELKRYALPAEIAAIKSCLSTIPGNASVSATSALVPHLTHRRLVFELDHMPRKATRYVAIDLATWHFPLNNGDVGRIVQLAYAHGYGVACSKEATVVLRQGARGRTLAPALRRVLASTG